MGMVADIGLHDKRTERGGNPHAHILLTLRDITPDGFGAKRRDWNDKALVTQWREAWATACNEALAKAGSSERVDHRSNKARRIDTPATVHTGRRTPWNAESWDAKTEFNAWVQTSIELAKVQAEVKRVHSQIIDLTSTIAQALAERGATQQVNQNPKSLHAVATRRDHLRYPPYGHIARAMQPPCASCCARVGAQIFSDSIPRSDSTWSSTTQSQLG